MVDLLRFQSWIDIQIKNFNILYFILIFFLNIGNLFSELQSPTQDTSLQIIEHLRLAQDYYYKSQYDSAFVFADSAVKLSENYYGKSDTNYSTAISILASIHKARQDYNLAEILFRQCSEISKNVYGKNSFDYSLCINNLASLYYDLGRYEEAEPLFLEALSIRMNILGEIHPATGKIINNLASLYDVWNLNERALEMYEKAKEIKAKTNGTNSIEYATTLDNLASYYSKIQKYDKAVEIYKESSQIFKSVYGENHSEYAISISLLGNTYLLLGKYDEAEVLLGKARDINLKIFGQNNSNYMEVTYYLGNLFESENHPEKSKEYYKEVLDICSNLIEKSFPYLSESEKMKYWDTMSDKFRQFFQFAAKFSQQDKTILKYLYEYYILTKGIILNSTKKVIETIRKEADKNDLKKLDDMIKIKKLKLSMIDLQLDNSNSRIIDSLSDLSNLYEKELSMKYFKTANIFEEKKIETKDIQKALQKHEAAVEIIRIIIDSIHVEYYALIIKKDNPNPDLVILKDGIKLENYSYSKYRKTIKYSKQGLPYIDALKDLYQDYWAPVAYMLKNIKKVYLSTDGIYNFLNLNTLIDPKSSQFVFDLLSIELLTNTKDFNKKNGNKKSSRLSSALLIGAPDYNLSIKEYYDELNKNSDSTISEKLPDKSDQVWSSLAFTEKEVDKINALFMKNNIKSTVLKGSSAIEERFKDVDNPSILHFATHGFFNSKENDKSGFQIKGIDNSLLKSGLVLAGANTFRLLKRQKNENDKISQTDDGILTALEAKDLNLDNTELVVLSACETALGEFVSGEGVYGLQRAFQIAGAKSIIMTLWPVNDQVTQELMICFYEKLLKNKDKRKAFRETIKVIMNKYPEIYFWGAFIMINS